MFFTCRMRPSFLMQRRISEALVSPALSAMLTGPVERVAIIALSSQLEPGFVCAPHRPHAVGSAVALVLRQLSGRCVQKMSFDGRSPSAQPSSDEVPMLMLSSNGASGIFESLMP